jgi:serine/threonine-protein kinase
MHPATIGRYEIKGELGRGGMATVFHAFDPRFKRDVAVKVLPREFLHDPTFRARFEREAQTIAGLEHPAIVPVYDFGEEAGQPFIVMRLMPGGALTDRLKAGPLPLDEAARIFNILAPALDDAHAHGIIHRDLKPGNILFDSRNQPYLSDFGIAKLSEASAAFTGSAIIGTPAYMSPEQAKGDRNLDGRSDLYALGAILFETLTGKLPYEADTPMGIAIKHIVEPVPRILDTNPQLPTACETIIGRAMAKDRAERFNNAQEMAAMLATVARGGAIAPSAPVTAPVVAPVPTRAAAAPETKPVRAREPQPLTPTIVTSAPAPPPVTPAPRTRAPIPMWMWAGGGVGLVAIVAVLFIGGSLLSGVTSPTPTTEPTRAAQATLPTASVGVTRAPTNTSAPPTPRPTNTPAPPTPVPPTDTLPPPTNTSAPPTRTSLPDPYSLITGIRTQGDTYVIDYSLSDSSARLHVHFFFNTVAPERAGVGLPGAGPWELYYGPSPYVTLRDLLVSKRGAATQMCILVAKPDHSIFLNTGNCVPLPP